MGNLVSGVFSLLLGWIRGIASGVWQFLSGRTGGSPLQWLGDNWLLLAVILCAAGTAADIIVHMLRWQPHKVWASFFRRLAHRSDDEEEAAEPTEVPVPAFAPAQAPVPDAAPQQTWRYEPHAALGASEEPPAPEDSAPAQPWQPPQQNDVPVWLSRGAAPSAPAQPTEAAATRRLPELRETPVAPQPEPIPAESAGVSGGQAEQASVTARLKQRMAAIPKQFGLTEEEDPYIIRFEPARPTANSDESYRAPVYPTRKEPAEGGRKHRRRAGTRRESGT